MVIKIGLVCVVALVLVCPSAWAHEGEAILEISKMTVKAGKDRMAPSDAIGVWGAFNGEEAELLAATDVCVSIGTPDLIVYDEFIPFEPEALNKGKFAHKGQAGNIGSLALDFNKGTFQIKTKGLDLSGLESPVVVEIHFGEFEGLGEANEAVVNGPKKSIPICLLAGVWDALAVDKARVKSSASGGDSLTIQGGIAAADMLLDLTDEVLFVSWSDFAEALEVGDFVRKKGNAFAYKKPKGSAGFITQATIDLDKCKFKIAIKGVAAGTIDGVGVASLAMAIESGTFDAMTNFVFTSNLPAGVELAIENEGTTHIQVGAQATYLTNPPASGPHWSVPGIAPRRRQVSTTRRSRRSSGCIASSMDTW